MPRSSHRSESAPGAPERPARCLVTGFEPFDGDAVNPSWSIAQALQGLVVLDGRAVEVHAVQLPCVFAQAGPALRAALRRHRPQLVLALGQAGRPQISLERVAINVNDARIADNAGARPIDAPVRAGAPAAYFSSLPIKAMWAALQQHGLPVEVSQTAGTFVCNHLFFELMHQLRRRPGTRGGFVHVPMLPEQAAARGLPGGMPLAQQIEALRLALHTAWAVQVDAVIEAGRLD
jgi:pyroglutamyl-peptidase